MQQVSRNKNLNIPKQVQTEIRNINSVEDEIATKKALAIANHKKFDEESIKTDLEERDKEWERIIKIPENANDLIAITVVKKVMCLYHSGD